MAETHYLSLATFLLIAVVSHASARVSDAHFKNRNSVSEDLLRQVMERQFSPYLKAQSESPSNGCQCDSQHYDCGCCVNMEIEQIDLNDTACVNITYLPDQYGISLTFSLDGKVLLNETVSAKNPPPICVGVPYLHDMLSLCIGFYNLDIQNRTFTGCIKVEARVFHVLEEDFDLGCFKIGGPSSKKMMGPKFDEKAQKEWLREMTVMQNKRRMQLKTLL